MRVRVKRHQELLRTQESINADLKAETEELKQRYSRHVQSATEELAAAQETSKQRLVRAQKREAQLREALYVTSRRGVPQDTTANPMEGAPASDEMSTAERTDDSAPHVSHPWEFNMEQERTCFMLLAHIECWVPLQRSPPCC